MFASNTSYWGETVRSKTLGGLVLTKSRYSAGEVAPDHSHEAATMCLVVGGAFEERTGSDTWHCPIGTVLYRPAGCPHSDRFLRADTETLGIDLSTEIADAGPRRPTVVRSRKTAAAIRALLFELNTKDLLSGLSMQSIVCSLQDVLVHVPDGVSKRPPGWLRRTRDRLHDAGAPAPTLAELATEANVHPMHLTRVFRGFYGCSIGDYARRRQIERCCELLGRPELELGEIASEAGFCDQAHFTRAFRSVKGCTPGIFRRRLRG